MRDSEYQTLLVESDVQWWNRFLVVGWIEFFNNLGKVNSLFQGYEAFQFSCPENTWPLTACSNVSCTRCNTWPTPVHCGWLETKTALSSWNRYGGVPKSWGYPKLSSRHGWPWLTSMVTPDLGNIHILCGMYCKIGCCMVINYLSIPY